ncbi:MAG: hypothetical protein JRI95_15095 [Deltaproteobacteria bacterium]|nr:hypothetical protein [Deltaproteobacteria bacterium]MBW2085541.1 hypothetical protein [Deltaproteobacteria bacterium]
MQDLPALAATGVGTVPFLEIPETLDRIARDCPKLPYWPQMIRSHPCADMILQFADRLPCLKADAAQRKVLVKTEDRAEALTEFYERFLAGDLDYFALPQDSAASFYAFLKRAKADPDFGPDFLKSQITGPITFGQAIRTSEGKSILDDPELADPIVKGLGIMAAWQAREIRAVGRSALVFIDEPSLTGFGSAFSTLNREGVIRMLNETAETARSHGEILVGIHICGNTDWEMILSTTLDVVNFDAFGYLSAFLLYLKHIIRFIERGGYLAWGIGPTLAYTQEIKATELVNRLQTAMHTLADQGLDLELLKSRTIITPACGLGPLDEPTAKAVSDLVARVSELIQDT